MYRMKDFESVSVDEPATEPLLDLRFAQHVHYSELTNSPNDPMCAVDRYLMGNQLTGDASVEGYRAAIATGMRCLESARRFALLQTLSAPETQLAPRYSLLSDRSRHVRLRQTRPHHNAPLYVAELSIRTTYSRPWAGGDIKIWGAQT